MVIRWELAFIRVHFVGA